MDINVLIIPFLSYIWFKYFRLRYIARNKSLSLLLRNILKYRCSQVALRIIIIFYGSISLSLSSSRNIKWMRGSAIPMTDTFRVIFPKEDTLACWRRELLFDICVANHAQDSNLAFPPLSASFHLLLPVRSQANCFALCPAISAGSIFR